MKRHARLTVHAKRLTPAEVAQHWFRRGEDFAKQIHAEYPTFPQAGPDGLYLLSQVEGWFDRLHGRPQISLVPEANEEEAAMRAALGRG